MSPARRKAESDLFAAERQMAGIGAATDVAREQWSEDFGRLLSEWSKRNALRSTIKVLIYVGGAAALITGILSFEGWAPILLCQMLLGLVYAHGVELVHECLHHNMFRHPLLNRLFGSLAGMPMLVSYSHCKYQHLHHHKYVGTD